LKGIRMAWSMASTLTAPDPMPSNSDKVIEDLLVSRVAAVPGVTQVRGFVAANAQGFDYVGIAESALPFSAQLLVREGYSLGAKVPDQVQLANLLRQLVVAGANSGIDITGLTPPAIANITKRLMQDNLIREAGRVRGAGGSSGAIVSALDKVKNKISRDATCVLILPDRGERYLDTIYSGAWVRQHFGEEPFAEKDTAI